MKSLSIYFQQPETLSIVFLACVPLVHTMATIDEAAEVKLPISQDFQTASEFIDQQLALEADAREVLPYVCQHGKPPSLLTSC